MKPVATIINGALRKAGLEARFVRGRGYYYVRHVAVSSGLYCGMGLEGPQDLELVRQHVNGVLAEEGLHFHINEELKCVEHPVGYTGYLRASYARVPLSLKAWQESIVNDVRAKRPGR